MRGREPKDPDKRQRRNKPPEQKVLPAGVAPAEYPELPKGTRYLARTKQWYETWATSEQATQFTATDWQRLQMLALLVDDYFRKPSKDTLAEIRLNEAKLGATPEDRQRLRWKIGEPLEEGGDDEQPRRSRDRDDPRGKLTVVSSA